MDKHHGWAQLFWTILIVLLLGGLGASYYLMTRPDEVKPKHEDDEAKEQVTEVWMTPHCPQLTADKLPDDAQTVGTSPGAWLPTA